MTFLALPTTTFALGEGVLGGGLKRYPAEAEHKHLGLPAPLKPVVRLSLHSGPALVLMIRRPEGAVFSPKWALGRLLACPPQIPVLSGGEGSADGQFYLCPGLGEEGRQGIQYLLLVG